MDPFQVPFAYALPTIAFTEKTKINNLLLRREKGIFIINDEPVMSSFVADAPVAFVALTEQPKGLSEVMFKTGNRKATFPF